MLAEIEALSDSQRIGLEKLFDAGDERIVGRDPEIIAQYEDRFAAGVELHVEISDCLAAMAEQQVFERIEGAILQLLTPRMNMNFANRGEQRRIEGAQVLEDDLDAFLVDIELAAHDHGLVAVNHGLELLIGFRPRDRFDCAASILEAEDGVP